MLLIISTRTKVLPGRGGKTVVRVTQGPETMGMEHVRLMLACMSLTNRWTTSIVLWHLMAPGNFLISCLLPTTLYACWRLAFERRIIGLTLYLAQQLFLENFSSVAR